MKTVLHVLDVRAIVGRGEAKVSVILLAAALLPAVHRAWGSIEFFVRIFGDDGGTRAPIFMFATAFLCLGLVPLVAVRRVFHEAPASYGLRLGDWKTGLASVLLFAPIIACALLYPASQTGEMRAFYPFAQSALRSWPDLMVLEVTRVLLFYTAWEFFFRGFILFGLERQFGAWPAICIQVIPQCLWHVGMPTGELLISIAGGVLFGIMALRTRSIVWPWLLHCFIGVCLDLMVVVTS